MPIWPVIVFVSISTISFSDFRQPNNQLSDCMPFLSQKYSPSGNACFFASATLAALPEIYYCPDELKACFPVSFTITFQTFFLHSSERPLPEAEGRLLDSLLPSL
jgi:hypothetical protein